MSSRRQTTEEPKQTLRFMFKATNLPNLDRLSKTDAYCLVYWKQNRNDKWTLLGPTSVVQDSLNPEWQEYFEKEYQFERCQSIKVVVWDMDDIKKGLTDQEYVGEVETTIGNLVGHGGTCQLPLMDSKSKKKVTDKKQRQSHLTIQYQELEEDTFNFQLGIRCRNIAKGNTFLKSDPFYRLYVTRENGDKMLLDQTDHISKTLDPSWGKVFHNGSRIANDLASMLTLEIWNWNSKGNHKLLHQTCFALNELSNGVNRLQFPVDAGKEYNQKQGSMVELDFQLMPQPKFVDYLAGGLDMGLVLSVDFTQSNEKNRLHSHSAHYPSAYYRAMQAVGSIIELYDSDGMIPVFGFGAKNTPSGSNTVQHAFALNGNEDDPEIAGLERVLETYHNVVNQVTLWGPTNFAPVIHKVIQMARVARVSQDNQTYFVLMILTDGAISDMDLTKKAIVESSKHPISIVIVGVGQANFDSMEELDGDDGLLVDCNGQKAEADIVQFVEYRKYRNSPEDLAAAVLEEVPDQLVNYFKRNGIMPNHNIVPPKQESLEEHFIMRCPHGPEDDVIAESSSNYSDQPPAYQ